MPDSENTLIFSDLPPHSPEAGLELLLLLVHLPSAGITEVHPHTQRSQTYIFFNSTGSALFPTLPLQPGE